MTAKTKAKPAMSDAVVEAKTGKTWTEWFAILDKAGAKKMSHKEIVACLDDQHDVGSWWRQTVTVTYEQARGLREKHEKPEGYSISVSRTLSVPVGQVYKAWNDAKSRKKWLAEEGIKIRTATPDKSLRITWVDGKTSLEVYLVAKGDSKSQVVVQHSKLANAREAAEKKAYWAEKLGGLKEALEK